MCLIIVCVVEVQFLINTLGNWLELPPHPLLLFVKLSWFFMMASRETNKFDQDRKCSSTLFKKTFQNLSINNSCDVGKCSTEYLLRSVKNLLSWDLSPACAFYIEQYRPTASLLPCPVLCPALSFYLIFALLTHRSMHWTRHTPPPPPQGLGPYFIKVWVTGRQLFK